MSMRYKGATLSATAPVTTGGEDGTAPGAWTLEQQAQAQAAGLWPLGPQPKYIEDVFSTWLYNGTGANATITNNIDLSTKGGLVWLKSRSGAWSHMLYDTSRGVQKSLTSNNSLGEQTDNATEGLKAFNTNGFNLGVGDANVNASGYTYASWTFRKQPKFFDVVTYTGTGANRAVAHALGSVPGCVIVKCTSTTGQWAVWHRSGTQLNNFNAYLNTTQGYADAGAGIWGVNGGVPSMTSTTFSLGTDSDVNTSGASYVAYLFSHNAGGFGLTGTDNVVSCGTYTGNGSASGPVIDLGYEPQWVLIKGAVGDDYNWMMFDTMRGLPTGGADARLFANASSTENSGTDFLNVNATGFQITGNWQGTNTNSATYIYIAIRRGPMKVPTDGTKVFAPIARTGTGSVATVNVGFAPDFMTTFYRADAGQDHVVFDRLRGPTQYLNTAATTQEINVSTNGLISFNNTSFTTNANGYANNSGSAFSNWVFGRAPGFFDEVCYTGTGANRTVAHNLAVVPELMIVKRRSATGFWATWATGFSSTQAVYLNDPIGITATSASWNGIPTASVIGVGTDVDTNASGSTYVSYLFATCPGVSKVGSYTGTGATQTINCGFAAGARFVLIKRTDSTGDWYVWDSARGMVSGTDPSLLLNSTAAEVNANSVYTATTGFQIVSTAAGINASGGSYIFLAVA